MNLSRTPALWTVYPQYQWGREEQTYRSCRYGFPSLHPYCIPKLCKFKHLFSFFISFILPPASIYKTLGMPLLRSYLFYFSKTSVFQGSGFRIRWYASLDPNREIMGPENSQIHNRIHIILWIMDQHLDSAK